MLLGQIFFVLKISNNHNCFLLIEGFCFAQLFEKRSGISNSWVNEKWIVQEMSLLFQPYLTEIEQCLLIHKKKIGKSEQAMV